MGISYRITEERRVHTSKKSKCGLAKRMSSWAIVDTSLHSLRRHRRLFRIGSCITTRRKSEIIRSLELISRWFREIYRLKRRLDNMEDKCCQLNNTLTEPSSTKEIMDWFLPSIVHRNQLQVHHFQMTSKICLSSDSRDKYKKTPHSSIESTLCKHHLVLQHSKASVLRRSVIW